MRELCARYFPILRGRQNELIAIRELAKENKLTHVVPIIEPIKASGTLNKTLVDSLGDNASIGIVANPNVGSFDDDLRNNTDFCKRYFNLLSDHEDKVRIFYRVSDEDANQLERRFSEFCDGFSNRGNWNVILTRDTTKSAALAVRSLQNKGMVCHVVATFPKPLNYFRRMRVLLTDGIKIRTRNADYRATEDEFFAENPANYSLYGSDGLADYSIVGEPFKSGGFSPRAVALHLTYFDEEGDIRIHHFVSDPPDDTGNVPGKYGSAVNSLYDWAEQQDEAVLPRTLGLDYFLETKIDERFPGLGSAKKYSIMHHLEMVNWKLGEVE